MRRLGLAAANSRREALMAPLHNLGAWRLSPKRRSSDHGGNGWRVALSCIPMLAGAVILVVIHRTGVAFFVLFASCTLLLILLVSSTS
jgi:Flp pilus assembly protein TadB